MKTKTQVFLEDIVSVGKDIIKNNLLIPSDRKKDHFMGIFSTIFFDSYAGSLIGGLYIASQGGDWRKGAELGFMFGFLYGVVAPVISLCIRDIRDIIKNYKNNLETRAKG